VASSPIARPRGTTDKRRTTTTNSSSSHHHDSAPSRPHPLICTGAEPIHPVHSPPKLPAWPCTPETRSSFCHFGVLSHNTPGKIPPNIAPRYPPPYSYIHSSPRDTLVQHVLRSATQLAWSPPCPPQQGEETQTNAPFLFLFIPVQSRGTEPSASVQGGHLLPR